MNPNVIYVITGLQRQSGYWSVATRVDLLSTLHGCHAEYFDFYSLKHNEQMLQRSGKKSCFILLLKGRNAQKCQILQFKAWQQDSDESRASTPNMLIHLH